MVFSQYLISIGHLDLGFYLDPSVHTRNRDFSSSVLLEIDLHDAETSFIVFLGVGERIRVATVIWQTNLGQVYRAFGNRR